MKQRRSRLVFTALTALAALAAGLVVAGSLASCAKRDLKPNNPDRIKIAPLVTVGTSGVEVNSTHSNSAQSKAPIGGDQELNLFFARADQSSASTYDPYAATALTATRDAGAGEQSLTFSPVQYYRADGLNTKLAGWYPQGTYDGATHTVSWTIDGQQDIMTAPKQEGSWTTPMPSMTFDHRLTQLRFHPYAEEQSTINSWGKITKIEVLNQQNTVYYALANDATGAVSFSGAATNSFSAGVAQAGVNMSLSTVADKATNAVQMGSAVMIAPQGAASDVLTVRIVTDKNKYKDVTLTGALTAGVPYRLYLRFGKIDITMEAALATWDDITQDGEIGGGERPINPPTASDYVTIGSLKWAKGNLVAKNGSECKVGASTDHGIYFHFGSLVGWSGGATGNGEGTTNTSLGVTVQVKPETYTGNTSWPAGYYTGGTAGTDYGLPYTDNAATGIGDPCCYYLGTPWRMPTAAENKTLFAGVGYNTAWNDVPGWSWQTTPAVGAISSNSLFFPASGYRHSSNGNISTVNVNGYIWSSSISSPSRSYSLSIYPPVVNPQALDYRAYGLPVRCVSEVPTVTNPPTASDYVTIGSLKWAKGNLVAKNGSQCKVGAPTDHGVYFHFGSLVGWSGGATGNGEGTTNTSLGVTVQVKPEAYTGNTSWPAGYYAGATTDNKGYNLPTTDAHTTGVGDPCRFYLGVAWRTPTATEYLALVGESGVNTNKALPLKLNSYDLYFPASGGRADNSGAFFDVSSGGVCWSSSGYNARSSFYLSYTSGYVIPQSRSSILLGFPVRCVSQ